MDYLLHILIVISIYGTAATALNLVSGYSGSVSLCHSALMGVGAYSAAILGVDWGLGFLPAVGLAVLLGLMLSSLIALISFRTKGDYFVIATFSAQMVFTNLTANWYEFTQGPRGIPGIPPPNLFGYQIDSRLDYLLLTLVLLIGALVISSRIVSAPYGRVLRAIREDEILTTALGKDTRYFRTTVFLVSGAMTSVVGAVLAYYYAYTDPTFFTGQQSIFLLSMVILGGGGSLIGPIVGAAVLIGLPEALRLAISSSVIPHIRQLLYGVALVTAIVVWHVGSLRSKRKT
jgi:branched-chain amino acid transport system permease protein